MLAMTLENFENDDLKRNLKKITEDKEDIILTANDEKDNIIILSLDKYNQLIKDIENAKYLAKLDLAYEQMIIDKKMNEGDGVLDGEGLPERLKHYDKAVYSRRIDQEHRLLYTVEDNHIYIFKCKGHYKE